jgi:hypothetical protein
MIHMRQPFFSIVSALVYLISAMLFAFMAVNSVSVSVGGADLSTSVMQAISGLFFVMAYFSLVHIKYK